MIHEKLTGRKMKRVCEERGLTVQEIQKKMGIGAHQSIYNWFNGKAMPTLDNYYTLCKILGVSMESLIVEDEGNVDDLVAEEATGEVAEQLSCVESRSLSVTAVIFWSDHLMEEIRFLGRAKRFRMDLGMELTGNCLLS